MKSPDLTFEGLPLKWDEERGTAGMWLFIITEAFLFVSLFFAYFYLGSRARTSWPPEPPKIGMALGMLGILLLSSLVLHGGEIALRAGKKMLARIAILATVALGAVFMGIQILEFRERLQSVQPWGGSYGSIFFTITGLHAAHLVLGVLMLLFVLILPRLEPAPAPPHRAMHDASLYWHFVDVVWVVIVAMLYLLPRLTIPGGAS